MNNTTILPTPVKLEQKMQLGWVRKISIHGDLQYWPQDNQEIKASNNPHGEIDITIHLGANPPNEDFQYYKKSLLPPEGYYIEVIKTGARTAAGWVTAPSHRGYYYAYLTFINLLKSPLYEGHIFDYPQMPIRGIVEGYYGTPWTMEERTRAFSVMSKEKMNLYVYAPKNDPYHRGLWYIPYPDQERDQLSKLIYTAKQNHIDFVYAISPGLSIAYTSVEQLEQLVSKCQQVHELGVNWFGLFLDDISSHLVHDQDLAQFSHLEDAQICLIQRLYSRMKEQIPNFKLMICPTLYFGRSDHEYISKIGQALPKDAQLLWTGRAISSPEIDVREARVFYETTGTYPLYWDNYPVNDANMKDEMHIGPLIGRHPHLYQYSHGLIANVMEYAEASLLPLITIGHYLWNPHCYSPEGSFRDAVEKIVGPQDTHAFIQISDCINQSSLSPLPGQRLIQQWYQFQREFEVDAKQAKVKFIQILNEYILDTHKLLAMPNQKLKQEMHPWLQQVLNDLVYMREAFVGEQIGDAALKATSRVQMPQKASARYGHKVKALGFFPELIVSEFLVREDKENLGSRQALGDISPH
jgi:hyaluronoglucosaminidase